jgi:hypothetical protein
VSRSVEIRTVRRFGLIAPLLERRRKLSPRGFDKRQRRKIRRTQKWLRRFARAAGAAAARRMDEQVLEVLMGSRPPGRLDD